MGKYTLDNLPGKEENMASHAKQLKITISEIRRINSKNLISRPEWGSANFEDIKDFLNDMYDYLDSLSTLNFDNLPENVASNVFQHAENLKSSILNIDNFSINNASNKNQFSNNLKKHYNNFYTALFPHIASLAYFSDGKTDTISDIESHCQNSLNQIQELQSEIEKVYQKTDLHSKNLEDTSKQTQMNLFETTNETIKTIHSEMIAAQNETKNELSNIKNDAKQLVEELRSEVTKKASSEFTEFYSDEAFQCRLASYGWALLTFILGIITLYISGLFSGLFDISYIL